MSIAATATREEKADYLFRPLEWALRICAYNSVMLLLMLANHAIDIDIAAYVAVITLCMASGLLFWGIRRVRLAAAGRI